MDWVSDPEFMDWVSDPELLKDTLLCLVGGHLDIICVCLWFLILPHTELGERLVKQ